MKVAGFISLLLLTSGESLKTDVIDLMVRKILMWCYFKIAKLYVLMVTWVWLRRDQLKFLERVLLSLTKSVSG